MNFIYHFVLISSISIIICKADLVLTEDFIEKIIHDGRSNLTGLEGHEIKLLPGGILGATRHSIVWNGTYNGQKVAIKIGWVKHIIDQEIEVYETLNATADPDIEEKGIAKIYYYGPLQLDDKYTAIAMTLFDGTVEDYLAPPRWTISDWSIAMIFKRAVEVLEYIHSKKVIHNDIKPNNLFLRSSDVFIGDFDIATINGAYSNLRTIKFASSKWHDGEKQRYEMDDLESLIFTMWDFAGCIPENPYGLGLLRSKNEIRAEIKVMKKCKFFKNDNIRKAFETVCKEMILDKTVPNYKGIYQTMDEAIIKATKETGQTDFEWLKKFSSK